MDNLSFEELKAIADSVAEKTLLEQISGGNANDCHDEIEKSNTHTHEVQDNTRIGGGSNWPD